MVADEVYFPSIISMGRDQRSDHETQADVDNAQNQNSLKKSFSIDHFQSDLELKKKSPFTYISSKFLLLVLNLGPLLTSTDTDY